MSDSLLRIGFMAVGAYFGGPIGASIGGMVANAVLGSEQQAVEGPKPTNTGITSSSHGTSIPIVLGTYVVSGQVVDGKDEIEVVRKTEGGGGGGLFGKGGKSSGPEVVTYETFATTAILLAEVPEKGMRYKLRRLWWNGRVVYDRRPGVTDSLETYDLEDGGFAAGLLLWLGGKKGGGIFSSAGEGVPNNSFTPTAGTHDLTWAFNGGTIQTLTWAFDVTGGAITLADNARNYVYVKQDGLTNMFVTSSISGWGDSDDVPLYVVETKDGQQVDVEDHRSFVNRDQFLTRHAKSDEIAAHMTFYDGSPDQEPDPTLETIHGVGNVPAYRGFSYLVFDRLPVTEEGGRIGQWEAELVLDGGAEQAQPEEVRGKVLHPWRAAHDPRNPRNTHEVRLDSPWLREEATDGSDLSKLWGPNWEDNPKAGDLFSGGQKSWTTLVGWSLDGTSMRTNFKQFPGGDYPGELTRVFLHYQRFSPDVFTLQEGPDFVEDNEPQPGPIYWTPVMHDDETKNYPGVFTMEKVKRLNPDAGTVLTEGTFTSIATGPSWNTTDHNYRSYVWPDLILAVKRIPDYPPQGCSGEWEELPGNPQWCVNLITGEYKRNLQWSVEQGDPGDFYAAADYETGAEIGAGDVSREVVTQYPLDPVVRSDHPWAGTSEAPDALSEAQTAIMDLEAVTAQTIELAEALRLINQRVNIGSDKIETAELGDRVLWGMAINGGNARQAIETLRAWGFFDHIESDAKLKFKPRGADPVLTIDAGDLGASDGGDASRLESTRAEDYELPHRVLVRYPSLNAGYEDGQQYAERQVTRSENDMTVDVSVAMTDDHAARIAAVVMNEVWRARNEREHSLPRKYDQLEPGDVVNLPLDGVSYRMRISEKTYQGAVSFRCVDDDAAEYSPETVYSGIRGGGAISRPVGPTNLLALDLPALVDAHGDAGYYIAMWGVSSTWKGALAQISEDGGTNWRDGVALDTAATVGKIVSPPGEGPSTLVDEANTIEVEMRSGDLSGTTELNFLNGAADTAAIGADGRWLLVTFKDVTQLPNGNLELSTLIQGRKGTEHHIGSVVANDWLVLINDALGRVQTQNAAIGNSRRLRAASVGSSGLPVSDQEFIYTGVNLKPFAPAHIRGQRNVDGDIALTWTRRTRLGGGWQLYPLYEESEKYELEFSRPGIDDTVLGTATVTVIPTQQPRYTYDVADQSADFGGVQASVRVRIYQISAVLGRGYVGEAIV